MEDKTTKVITCVKTLAGRGYCLAYYRLGVYEFVGEPPTARFVEDLDVGSYDYTYIVRCAEHHSKKLNLLFIPGVSMGSSIDVIFKHLFADKKTSFCR